MNGQFPEFKLNDVEFIEVQRVLSARGVGQSAAEIHGAVTGWICAGARWEEDARNRLVTEYLGLGQTDSLQAVLDRLHTHAIAGLEDDTFAFRLLLPDDDASLNERSAAAGDWCRGFLAGFGMAGRFREEELPAEVSEIFNDIARIAMLSEEVPDDDDNEADLTEIIEYIRMSAVMVFTECAHQAT